MPTVTGQKLLANVRKILPRLHIQGVQSVSLPIPLPLPPPGYPLTQTPMHISRVHKSSI